MLGYRTPEGSGWIAQAYSRGDADDALIESLHSELRDVERDVERLAQGFAHGVDFHIGRGPVQVFHGADPQGGMAAQCSGVQGGGGFFKGVEKIGHFGEPIPVAQQVEWWRRAVAVECQWSQTNAAIPNDDGGNALAGLVVNVESVEGLCRPKLSKFQSQV